MGIGDPTVSRHIPAGSRLISRVGDAPESCAGTLTGHPTSYRYLSRAKSRKALVEPN